MVTMESDGYAQTLRMEDDDIHAFQRVNDGWEITFKRATLTTNYVHVAEVMRDYTKNTDLEDKKQYWKTEELIRQLKQWRDDIKERRDNYKRIAGMTAARSAFTCEVEISLLNHLLDDLETGNEIWLQND